MSDFDELAAEIGDDALAAVEAAGWVLVPAEPTEAMLAAGFAVESGTYGDGSVGALIAQWREAVRAEYLAMIAARPPRRKSDA